MKSPGQVRIEELIKSELALVLASLATAEEHAVHRAEAGGFYIGYCSASGWSIDQSFLSTLHSPITRHE